MAPLVRTGGSRHTGLAALPHRNIQSGIAADQLLYRDFNKETVYKALARKGETLKHLWQKYNAVGIVDGKKPMSYRQYCRRYSEWTDSKQLTFHIQRYPGVNLELDYAGKQLYLHNRRNPEDWFLERGSIRGG